MKVWLADRLGEGRDSWGTHTGEESLGEWGRLELDIEMHCFDAWRMILVCFWGESSVAIWDCGRDHQGMEVSKAREVVCPNKTTKCAEFRAPPLGDSEVFCCEVFPLGLDLFLPLPPLRTLTMILHQIRKFTNMSQNEYWIVIFVFHLKEKKW